MARFFAVLFCMLIKGIISGGGKLLAKIFSHKLEADGVKFLTDANYVFQVGLIQHKEAKDVRLHKHAVIDARVRCQSQEFIYIERGRVEVAFYDDNFKPVSTATLGRGDFMLQVSGGHEFRIHKGARLIEVKQGPYLGDRKAKIYK